MYTCIKAALDPCNHYVCIYLKTMQKLRRLKLTTNEIFMSLISFYTYPGWNFTSALV